MDDGFTVKGVVAGDAATVVVTGGARAGWARGRRTLPGMTVRQPTSRLGDRSHPVGQDQAMARALPRPVTMPWGKGQVVDEVSAHDQYKEAVIQLIEWDGGDQTLRFCQYWPDGRFQRQPMMIGVDDMAALRDALRANERLLGLVRQLVDEP